MLIYINKHILAFLNTSEFDLFKLIVALTEKNLLKHEEDGQSWLT